MSRGEHFDVFWGGFLLNSSTPLEFRGNKCSHACWYCFDRLNGRDPVINAKQAFSLLANFPTRTSPAAKLLQAGYPVLCSNHTDPLSANNADIYLPFIELMETLGVPYSIQSRGGQREDELISMISKPIVWYISIDTDDPDKSKRISPGAPSPAQRLKLIEKLHDKGHKVAVGINPLHPEFLPNPSPLIDRLHDLGVRSLWIHSLHISAAQKKRMSPAEQAKSESALATPKNELLTHYEQTKAYAIAKGMAVYNNQQKERSDYFNIYADIYPKRYPLMQEWVNLIYDTKSSADLIFWKDFRDYFLPKLPSFPVPTREHLNAMVHPKKQGTCRDRNGNLMDRWMSYEDLLWVIWNYSQTLLCPANVDCFAWAGIPGRDNNDWTRYVDDDENPILIFKPEGTNGYAYTSADLG